MPPSLVETLWTIIQRLQVRLSCAAPRFGAPAELFVIAARK